MTPTGSSSVFSLDSVPEIHLARAPVEKVLTAVQFSLTPDLVSGDGERQLAAALARYPVRRQGQSFNFAIGLAPASDQNKAMTTVTTRVFADPSQAWTVTVTETTVSLETKAYESREDFCNRAREVFDAVAAVAAPPIVDRVGLRYVDRLCAENDLRRLGEYVNPRLRVLHGAVSDPLRVEHSVSDTIIRIADDEHLRARSGLLPPGGVFDPVLMPVPDPSWVLDIDIFTTEGGIPFDPAGLEARLRLFATHSYSFFRWATTDAFLREFQQPAAAAEAGSS